MFKWLTLFILVVSGMVAAEEEAVSPLEMLMFKIGFTAMVDEFEREKNTTALNTERIAQLEKNFELLVKFMEMTKRELVSESDITPSKGGGEYGIYNVEAMKKELSSVLESYKKELGGERDAEISRLKSEIAALKRDIRLLADNRAPRAVKKSPAPQGSEAKEHSSYRVVVDELNIRHRPSHDAKSDGKLLRDTRVQFAECDRYGWCRLEQGGYVPKHLFLPAE